MYNSGSTSLHKYSVFKFFMDTSLHERVWHSTESLAWRSSLYEAEVFTDTRHDCTKAVDIFINAAEVCTKHFTLQECFSTWDWNTSVNFISLMKRNFSQRM